MTHIIYGTVGHCVPMSAYILPQLTSGKSLSYNKFDTIHTKIYHIYVYLIVHIFTNMNTFTFHFFVLHLYITGEDSLHITEQEGSWFGKPGLLVSMCTLSVSLQPRYSWSAV